MPPDLSRAADEIAEWQREAEELRRKEEERKLAERKARDAQSALEEPARERTQLFHAAAVEPVAKLADWRDWRDRAEPAMAEASKVAETRRWARMPARRWRHRRRSSRAASRSTLRRRRFTATGRVLRPIGSRPHPSLPRARKRGARRSHRGSGGAGSRIRWRCRRFSGWGSAITGRGRRNGAGSESAGPTWPASPRGRSRARRNGCGTRAVRCERRRRSWTTG